MQIKLHSMRLIFRGLQFCRKHIKRINFEAGLICGLSEGQKTTKVITFKNLRIYKYWRAAKL